MERWGDDCMGVYLFISLHDEYLVREMSIR